jgi:hypothetical protein
MQPLLAHPAAVVLRELLRSCAVQQHACCCSGVGGDVRC